MMNMGGGTKEARLAFLRRMIWWMPALAFAIVTTVLVVLNLGLTSISGDVGSAIMTGAIWGLLAAVIVGVIVVAAYMGYKMMMDRQP